MVVLEAELAGRLVAQLDQLLQVGPRPSRRRPCSPPRPPAARPSPSTLGARLRTSLSVSTPSPTSARVDVERLLDRVRLGGDALSSSGSTCFSRYIRYSTSICARSSGSAISPSRIAFSSAKRLGSERAASSLFWASSLAAKSSSLPLMFAFHQARPAISSGRMSASNRATNSRSFLGHIGSLCRGGHVNNAHQNGNCPESCMLAVHLGLVPHFKSVRTSRLCPRTGQVIGRSRPDLLVGGSCRVDQRSPARRQQYG